MYLSLIAKWWPSLSILKGHGFCVIYRDCCLGKWDVIVATFPLCSRWDLEWSFTVEIKGPEMTGISFKIHFLPHIVHSIFSNVTCKLNVMDLQFFLFIPKKEINLANMKCLNKNISSCQKITFKKKKKTLFFNELSNEVFTVLLSFDTSS